MDLDKSNRLYGLFFVLFLPEMYKFLLLFWGAVRWPGDEAVIVAGNVTCMQIVH